MTAVDIISLAGDGLLIVRSFGKSTDVTPVDVDSHVG